MISGLHIGTELRRFSRHKLTRLALLIMCIMPILYSTLYLWSFWNPFGQIDRVPVALVNADRGAIVEGEKFNAGQQVADGLLEDNSLNWHFVSQQEALDGVREGRYYFAVELPPDFSEAVTSPSEKDNPHPRKAVIEATYNDANGYLSTMIGENAMRVVLNVVSERIGAEAVDKVLVGLLDAGMGLSRAADGAGELSEGLGKLADGSATLNEGLGTAVRGTGELAQGTDTLVDGTGRLKDGSAQLADGTVRLADGVDELAAGVNAASGTISEIESRAQRLTGEVDAYGNRIAQASDSVRTLEAKARAASDLQAYSADEIRGIARTLDSMANPASAQAARSLRELAVQLDTRGLGPESEAMQVVDTTTGFVYELDSQFNDPDSQLRSALNGVSSGVSKFGELRDGVNQLQDGAHQLRDGAQALDSGIGELQGGAVKLQDGAHQLRDGSVKLQEGGQRLGDGIVEAKDGSDQLASGLRGGADQMPTWNPQQREDVASVMGGPVQVSDYNDAGRNTFGAGLAPFFFALSLYIGGIIMFFLLKPMQRRAVASGMPPLRATIDGFLTPAVIAIGQALAVVGLTLLATPLEVPTIAGLVGFGILVSLMFAAFNQMFLVLLGTGPGRVVSMAFLMVQMVASGGLYPIETEPKALQILHPFMPMKYAVDGFRQLMYGFYDARLPISIVVILGFTVLALALTTVGAARDRTWNMKRLHPKLEM